ncbi:MAG TPA: glycosyltransferase, partial [Nitratifractor sp.]|nr:glycosyltransferase [Nitratifractor sp.]
SFERDNTIGQITGKNTVLDSKRYAYGNNGRIKWLCEQCSVPFSEEYTFAGGTMFWSRTDVIKPLVELFESGRLEFEEERGQKDHTIAHAIERFFGILVKAKGMTIEPSPSDYAKMPKELVEDTSALVLSQQYAGQDVYEKINELNEYVHELEAIAESMRMKNRIKRLPKDIVRIAKEKGALSVATLLSLKEQKSKVDLKKLITPAATVLKNPQVFKKVFYYLKRGEVKYLYVKAKEKIKKNLANSNEFVKIDPKEFFAPFDAAGYTLDGHRVDIIIPVYNGYEYLEPLFKSIKENTSSEYRLIITEDASPDERVKPLLRELVKEHPGAVVLENEENLGFVKSVNKALKEVKENFVILNTDTEVPQLWLERLMYPIFKMPNVASTTPFTNAGTIASFPKFLEDNAIFEGLQVDVIDKHFQQVNAQKHYASMPTGIGFCMGINYKLTQEIGFFDEKVFGKGYGEENDWCQRAIENGYQNLLVPNLFVYHKHGGSFPSELKQKLLDENYQKLLQKHPTYDKQVQEYISKDPHK